jgi:threonine/homoserine/homoserine lactone efflux protein
VGALAVTAFLLVAVVVIVSPGQDTALTVRNTLSGGRGAGFLTAVGVVAGQLVWVIAASAGIAAVLVASEPAFVALRVAGGLYLVYLGTRSLCAAWRGRGLALPCAARGGPRAPVREGVLSNLGNPKMAVFFTTLLPQFASSFGGLLALGVVFVGMTLGWLSLYAIVVAKAGRTLRRPGLRRMLDSVTGVVLVAFGVRLATERR